MEGVIEKITKDNVRSLVESHDRKTLLALFDEDPDRVRRYLTRLAYAPDGPLHAETIDCIRFLSLERSSALPEFFRETMRRHIWAMNEEGGNIDWAAPEIIGAVIAGNPALFGEFFSFAFCAAIDEASFQPSLVRAFDIVAPGNEVLVKEFEPQINALRVKLQDGR